MTMAAVIQLNCTEDVEANLQGVESLVRGAADAGAEFICTPENTNFLGPQKMKVELSETLEGPTCTLFSSLARELGAHLLLGSFNERSDVEGKCFNTSVLFSPTGEMVGIYRKIHLFDLDLSRELSMKESDGVEPGCEVVVAETEIGNIGMTICYDLRFPELYRALRTKGASMMTVPAAFTMTTGMAHWEVLLRARAIETQSYVLAPAQFGKHDDQEIRESYGHAMIIDPWGQVLAEAGDGEGFVTAEIEMDEVVRIRNAMPVVSHRRL